MLLWCQWAKICVTGYCRCLIMVIYVRWKIDLFFFLWHSAQRCQVTAATHTGKRKSIKREPCKAICIFGCSCNSSCRTSAPACCRYLLITASIWLSSLSGKVLMMDFFSGCRWKKTSFHCVVFLYGWYKYGLVTILLI